MLHKIISRTLPYFPPKLIWQFSKSYIAGETSQDAINASKALNRENIMVTLDILGEFIKTMSQAAKNRYAYLTLIRTIEAAGINANYSLKPTMFGLLIDKKICFEYIRELTAEAASHGNFIRIDMENSPCVDDSIDIFRRLKREFPQNIGLVLQAYLKRTLNDLESMLDLRRDDAALNFRLVKGIYVEPADIAYKDYHEINDHFLKDLEFMLKNKIDAAIATHDTPLIQGALHLIDKYQVPKEHYEFQMLYGVTPKKRRELVKNGHRMRVYVPFGEQWFGYSTRRLKENPAMVKHIIKALFYKE
ncbi:proline dehydrogenase [Desulfobacter hydrogenophilus]|uniref:proline dehydrogenase n=1 Tax=Desulfobacter hydrogenophilus TaxID=2291 RepID=A0A328FBN6_9BACT|nr:proline dehydrogenase family protein [Desulfobacter hydrogenophilus]NDY73251.1 proline dehydrogenase [Desulfobacter hydrogenophilus]QBH13827.1 proline dehydrogenase [Desulfobacter hydrogenophilus]RAM00842.1 proline dehydrogenase [Desulfobacter hydrogenophilus]